MSHRARLGADPLSRRWSLDTVPRLLKDAQFGFLQGGEGEGQAPDFTREYLRFCFLITEACFVWAQCVLKSGKAGGSFMLIWCLLVS